MADPLLSVRDLATRITLESGDVRAIEEVSFDLDRGRTLGIVGESGCGKSLTALSVMGLLSPPLKVEAGEVRFEGKNLLALSENEMRKVRGNRISMVFQEPMTSLNPVFKVGDQIGEVVRVHRGATRRQAREKAVEMLFKVGIPAPEQRVDAYPHELSGGMRQRVMIAMALACDPALLIADEPTTALDVTIQAQILELIRALQKERGMAVMLITHDLGVVAETCEEVVVMYAGQVAERATVSALFEHPMHPYTAGLLASIPTAGERRGEGEGGEGHDKRRLRAIPGRVPGLTERPAGCRFRDRCDRATAVCEQQPPLLEREPGHFVACHHPVEAKS